MRSDGSETERVSRALIAVSDRVTTRIIVALVSDCEVKSRRSEGDLRKRGVGRVKLKFETRPRYRSPACEQWMDHEQQMGLE